MNRAKRVYSLDKIDLTIELLKPRSGLYNYAMSKCNGNIWDHNDIYSLSDDRKVLKELALSMKEERIKALEEKLECLINKKI